MANGRKTGGRRPGSQNRKTVERAARIAKALARGVTPLDYMLGVLRNRKAKPADRQWAASAAAPYVHPRLAATLVQEVPNGTLRPAGGLDDVLENARLIAFAMAEAAELLKRQRASEPDVPALPAPPEVNGRPCVNHTPSPPQKPPDGTPKPEEADTSATNLGQEPDSSQSEPIEGSAMLIPVGGALLPEGTNLEEQGLARPRRFQVIGGRSK